MRIHLRVRAQVIRAKRLRQTDRETDRQSDKKRKKDRERQACIEINRDITDTYTEAGREPQPERWRQAVRQFNWQEGIRFES